MKKIFLLLITLLVSNSYASDVVFKCISADGEISYLNISKEKKGTCSNTQLGQVSAINTTKNSSNSTKNNITNATFSMDSEQKEKNDKRKTILSKELEEEKTQLNTLNVMLKNIPETDSSQMTQVKEMQNIHIRNIATLEKELGINKNINIAVK